MNHTHGETHEDAERHTNPDGSLGGLVDPTAEVDAESTVSEHGIVSGYTKVRGGVVVADGARVAGHVWVTGSVHIPDGAEVYGHGRVTDGGDVAGDSLAYRSAVRAYSVWVEAGRVAP
jgi:UDP-3-O-[3-hydroxymyristoyl] glucosamine N-acyltransferase